MRCDGDEANAQVTYVPEKVERQRRRQRQITEELRLEVVTFMQYESEATVLPVHRSLPIEYFSYNRLVKKKRIDFEFFFLLLLPFYFIL